MIYNSSHTLKAYKTKIALKYYTTKKSELTVANEFESFKYIMSIKIIELITIINRCNKGLKQTP